MKLYQKKQFDKQKSNNIHNLGGYVRGIILFHMYQHVSTSKYTLISKLSSEFVLPSGYVQGIILFCWNFMLAVCPMNSRG